MENVMRVSDGALVAFGRSPIGCNLERELADDSAWCPEMYVIFPDEKNVFLVGENSVRLEGLPYYIKKEGGFGFTAWHAKEDILDNMNFRSYIFLPGSRKNERLVYNLEEAFVPDQNDVNQECLDIGIFGHRSLGYFGSSDSGDVVHVNPKHLPWIIYEKISSPHFLKFGYDCHHSGSLGLPSVLTGTAEFESSEKGKVAHSIVDDLAENLGLKI